MAEPNENAGVAHGSVHGQIAPASSTTYDALCACRNGYIKAITFSSPAKTQTTQVIRCDFPATLMRRNPFAANELIVVDTDNSAGNKNVVIPHVYKVDTRTNLKSTVNCDGIKGQTVGIAFGDGNTLYACQSDAEGNVYKWRLPDTSADDVSTPAPELIFSAGVNLECMEQYRNANDIKLSRFVATGGEENDVAVFDLSRTDAGPIFRAKNIPPNWVQLREPVWVRKLCIMDADCQRILCGTNHHQIRLYDRRVAASADADAVSSGTDNLCRPAVNFNWYDVPVTGLCMNHANDNQIFAGNSLGKLEMLDLRMKGVVYAYKGVGGTIKALDCHPKQDVLLVGSLDRFVRIFDVKSRRMLKEVYTKSEVNDAVIFKSDDNISWETNVGFPAYTGTIKIDNAEDERRGDKRRATTDDDIVNDEIDATGRTKKLVKG